MLNRVINKVQQVFNHQHFHQDIDWDDDFSGATELDTVIEVKEQLAKIDFLEKKKLKANIQLVLDLDQAVCRKMQNVTHSYLTSLKNSGNLKKSIEVVMYEYLRQLYMTYALIFDELQYQKKLKLSTDEINLILVRYLNALFLMAKWRYFDNQAAPLGVWKNVHKVIKLAENLSIMNKCLFLYEFQNKETSIATILERGFMLDTLQKENYSQLEIELTDRVIRTWSANPVISKEYAHNEYQFFIHLEGDERPQRLRGVKNHANFRYWKTVRIVDLIETYLCAVDTQKPLDEFNLITMAATEDIVQLFKKLRVDWCVDGYKRQRRSECREPNFDTLNVSYGIEDVCLRVRRVQAESAIKDEGFVGELAIGDQNTLLETFNSELNIFGSENWTMLEESSTGFSVELGKDIGSWIKSGALIGYSTIRDKSTIAIAKIISVRKKANGSHRLGLSKITSNAIALKVSLVQKSTAFNPIEGYEVDDGEENLSYSSAFLSLLIDEGGNSKPKLIVPRSMYKPAHRYKVNMQGKDHMMTAGGVTNKHRNWVCFEVTV